MNTERKNGTRELHMINVAFHLDTTEIQKQVEETARKEVVESIKDGVEQCIYGCNWSGRIDKNDRGPIRNLVSEKVDEIVSENKDLIINQAAELLCEKMYRSKKCKEKLAEITAKGE